MRAAVPRPGISERSRAELFVARRAFRQVWLGAAVWAVVFGGSAALSALSYASTYPTQSVRQDIAATTGRDTGFAVLLGPLSDIGTVGGYTVYKCFVFLTTIGALWALLAATRLLRGEEDAGRWQLVLAGATRGSRATAATLAALGVAVAVVFAGTVLIMVIAGRDDDLGLGVGETLLYGASLAIAPAVFGAVGALTSQLGRTRRVATALGIVAFGIAVVLRMIGDSGPHAHWLRWLTPFGWTELMRPYTRNDPWPLLPAAVTVLTLCVAAVVLASRRDAGEGVLAARDVSPVRSFGLGSPFGLALRLDLPVLAAWCVGVAAAAFAFGVFAKVTAGGIPDSVGNTLDKFGVHGGVVSQFLGVGFVFVASVVALLPVSQVGAASAEETSGRLHHVLSGPTRRSAVFAGRLAIGWIAAASAGLVAGIATWLGTTSQGLDVGLATMVGAGLNVVPTALMALGVGAVVLASAPRAAVTTIYVLVIGSLVIYLLGSMVPGVRWVEHLSLFHYMALAPSEEPDPGTVTITLLASALLCVLATVLFSRRDLQSG
jgi:ABC-2 type transport system permease protein